MNISYFVSLINLVSLSRFIGLTITFVNINVVYHDNVIIFLEKQVVGCHWRTSIKIEQLGPAVLFD